MMHGISAARGEEGHIKQRQCLIWGRGRMYAQVFKGYRRSTRSIFRKVLFKRNFMNFGNKELGQSKMLVKLNTMVAENHPWDLNS